jgi:FkbM family methyltransferase
MGGEFRMGKSYSQDLEDQMFINYFGEDYKGNILEIGAYNPEVFSNSRRLILNGWGAVLVEASTQCFNVIKDFYKNDSNVEVINYAIGGSVGWIDFYDSAGAVATSKKEHYDKWKDLQLDYKKTRVESIMFEDLYSMFPYKFDCISIDTEGMDYEVVKQIDFNKTGTSLVCIEYTYNPQEIYDYIRSFDFRHLWSNSENLIMVK